MSCSPVDAPPQQHKIAVSLNVTVKSRYISPGNKLRFSGGAILHHAGPNDPSEELINNTPRLSELAGTGCRAIWGVDNSRISKYKRIYRHYFPREAMLYSAGNSYECMSVTRRYLWCQKGWNNPARFGVEASLGILSCVKREFGYIEKLGYFSQGPLHSLDSEKNLPWHVMHCRRSLYHITSDRVGLSFTAPAGIDGARSQVRGRLTNHQRTRRLHSASSFVYSAIDDIPWRVVKTAGMSNFEWNDLWLSHVARLFIARLRLRQLRVRLVWS